MAAAVAAAGVEPKLLVRALGATAIRKADPQLNSTTRPTREEWEAVERAFEQLRAELRA
jgi:hypothetical protein